MTARRLILAALLVASGCGGLEPRSSAASRVATAPARSALSAYLLPRGGMHAHVRFDALSALAPDGDGLAALQQITGETLPEELDLSARCGRSTSEAIDELTASVDEDGVLVSARTTLRDVAARRCALALSPDAREATFAGRPAVRVGDLVVVASDGLVLLGSEDHVRAALERPPGDDGADPMEALGAPGDSLLRVYARTGEGLQAGGLMQLTPTPEGLEMRYALFAATVADADVIDRRYRSTLTLMRERHGPTLGELLPVIDRLEVRRSVGAATVVRAQVPRTEALPALTKISEVHRRVEAGLAVWGHIERAETQLDGLAQALVAYVAREREKKRPARFPPSVGPTPAALPPADGLAMTRHDWRHPTWVLLGHALEGRVFHRYEIQVDPYRRRATLRASSDLDGDGEPLVLQRVLTIRQDGTVEIGKVEVLERATR